MCKPNRRPLAAKLRYDPAAVAEVTQACRSVVLRAQIAAKLAADAELAEAPIWRQFREIYGAYTQRDPADETPFKAAVAAALREVRSYNATARSRFVNVEALPRAPLRVDRVDPVYYEQAEVARRCGTTVFERDEQDGVTRRRPLMIRHGDNVLPQLAVALACDLVGQAPVEIGGGDATRPKYVRIGDVRIQIDAHGRALVPWLPQQDWRQQFTAEIPGGAAGPAQRSRIPADLLCEAFRTRIDIRDNEQLIRQLRAQLFTSNLFPEAERGAYAEYGATDGGGAASGAVAAFRRSLRRGRCAPCGTGRAGRGIRRPRGAHDGCEPG